jgi:hypothetical protein
MYRIGKDMYMHMSRDWDKYYFMSKLNHIVSLSVCFKMNKTNFLLSKKK